MKKNSTAKFEKPCECLSSMTNDRAGLEFDKYWHILALPRIKIEFCVLGNPFSHLKRIQCTSARHIKQDDFLVVAEVPKANTVVTGTVTKSQWIQLSRCPITSHTPP